MDYLDGGQVRGMSTESIPRVAPSRKRRGLEISGGAAKLYSMKTNEPELIEQPIVQPDDSVFPVLGLISNAQSTLDIKQFSLTEPECVAAIIGAHRRGVMVRVMLNPKNTAGEPENNETFATLEAANVPVRWTNPAFLVTHEKSLIADGRRVLIHTFNLGHKYFTETRDVGVITQVPEVVAEVQACFNADWERLPFTPHVPELLWGPINGRLKMAQFIDSARHRLDVCHPRFVDTTILERLLAAHARGVHVRVLCGGKHGVKEWDLFDTLSSLRMLKQAQIKLNRMKHLKVHIKLLIADNERALIGSMNIHRSAFTVRRELGVIVAGQETMNRVLRIFEEDWHKSHEYDPPDPLAPASHPQDDLPDDPQFHHD
jgi:phosphatidylserine/phosphatidylglycerophosphate/cardiolipin synthase-like enzyme